MFGVLIQLIGAFVKLFAALNIYLLINEVIYRIRYRKKAKELGCTAPMDVSSRPFGLPRLIQIRRLSKANRQLSFFVDMFAKLETMTVRLLTFNTFIVLTVDPENIKTILATSFKDYSLGIRYNQLFPLLGNGIFTLSGEGWKHSRALLRPQFSREQVSQLQSLNNHVNTLIRVLRKKSKQDNHFFDVQTLFHDLTIDTATEFLFGQSVGSLTDSQRQVQGPKGWVSASQFAESFTSCLETLSFRIQTGPLYWLVDSWKFRKNIGICHNFVDYFVHRTLEQQDHSMKSNVVDRYVFIEELAKETNDPIVIRDQAFNILLAGRDTTASLLSFIVFHLARDKKVWTKLRAEIIKDFGEVFDPSKLSFESLKRCEYLKHVISEVLRLHPIVPINFRSAIRDTVLPRGGGPDGSQPVLVRKGMRVVYSIHVTQRLPQYWGDDASVFRPERWEEPANLHSWDYLPFNGGPRICLGQQFALTETSYTIVRLAQEFHTIHYCGDASYIDLPQNTKLTTNVAGGVLVSFE